MKRFLWYQAPFLAACIAIFAVSSLQRVPEVPLPVLQDKIPHAIVFGILAVLAHRAFFNQGRIPVLARVPMTSAFLFSLFYGALDELHQYYVPGRNTDIWDLVADVVGAAIGLAILSVILRRRKGSDGKGGSEQHGI